jgi:hypothetical protein
MTCGRPPTLQAGGRTFRDGWDNPDLSFLAIHELSERLNDYPETGEAVRTTDVFLAMDAVDALLSLIVSLRQIPNAPDNVDVREFISRVLLQPMGIEPLTAEEIAACGKPVQQ